MQLFVRKNKDDEESKEFYYLGRIWSNREIQVEGKMLPYEFKMKGTNVSAVKIGYQLETPVEKKLYDYLTLAEV